MKRILLLCLALFLIVGSASALSNWTRHPNNVLYIPANITFADYSPIGHTVTAGGGANINQSQYKMGNASMWFDGSGDYADSAYSSDWDFGNGNFSISFWMYPTQNTATYGVLSTLNASGYGYRIIFTPSSNTWYLGGIPVGTATTTITASTASYPAHNQWNQIVVTREADYIYLWCNGTLGATGAVNYSYNYAPATGSTPLRLGQSRADVSTANPYTGFIDELVIYKGASTLGAYVPTVEYFNNPTAGFNVNQSTGYNNIWVNFTNTSTGNPPSLFKWTFTNVSPGNGTEIQFATTSSPEWNFGVGDYYINQTVSNTRGNSSAYGWVNVSSVPTTGFYETDINLTPAYSVTIHVTDTAGEIIPNVNIQDSSGTIITTTNGTATFSEPYGVIAYFLSADGYRSKSVSYIVDADIERTVMLEEGTPATTPVTWYSPYQVQLKIVDLYGKPLEGAFVSINYMSDSLPSTDTSWLQSYFGIEQTVAEQMVNSSLVEDDYTATDGTMTFPAFSSIRYNVTIINSTMGLSNNVKITPKDSMYVIYCRLASQTVANNTLAATLNATLPWYKINSTAYKLGVEYQDLTGCTSDLHFNVTFRNGTHVYGSDLGYPGTSIVLDNYTIISPALGTEYIWRYNATKSC